MEDINKEKNNNVINELNKDFSIKHLEEENSSLKNKIKELRANNNSFLFTALAKAQAEFPIVGKGSRSYNGKYASLATILKAILPILNKHGLSIMQPLVNNENGEKSIMTRICHSSGQTIEDTFTLVIENDPKKIKNILHENGKAITYFRRYCFSSTLGVITDEDTDGN